MKLILEDHSQETVSLTDALEIISVDNDSLAILAYESESSMLILQEPLWMRRIEPDWGFIDHNRIIQSYYNSKDIRYKAKKRESSLKLAMKDEQVMLFSSFNDLILYSANLVK